LWRVQNVLNASISHDRDKVKKLRVE